MIDFEIERISASDDRYVIDWRISSDLGFVNHFPMYAQYGFAVNKSFFFPVNIALSALLPALVKEHGQVRVITPYALDEITTTYWPSYISCVLASHQKYEEPIIVFESRNEGSYPEDNRILMEKGSNIGLLFGGGVESLFALTTLIHKKPVLISVIGEHWMNNDKGNAKTKFDIEAALVRNTGLNLQRIDTNLRTIIAKGDEYVNRYLTGAQMYFLSLPIAERFGLGVIYQSMEFEYAANFSDWDLSISPRFTKELFIKNEKFPLLVSIYNSFPKVEMFERLARTGLIQYVYSCFHNTDKRWCGKCSKCFRISEYCERIGLDRKIIGMQEGIVGRRESSPLAKLYWLMMDKLYGRRYGRELKLHFLFYGNEIMNFYKKILTHFSG